MKKEKSSILWWLITPTYKYAERKKHELIDSECTKSELSNALKNYNSRYLLSSSIICITASVLIPFGNFLFEGGFYNHPFLKYILGSVVALIAWGFLVSRSIEIFKAFLNDAVEKLDGDEASSDLKYGQRLRLSYKSYLELIINFSSIYYLVPSSFYKNGYQFDSIFEAIYFSGVTITTLGYGDISPVNPILQLLSVLQVLTGFVLIVVCFAIYSSLALGYDKTNK